MFAKANEFSKKFTDNEMYLNLKKYLPPMPTISTEKYYYSYIIAILVTILGLFYYLNEKQNIFKKKMRKKKKNIKKNIIETNYAIKKKSRK